ARNKIPFFCDATQAVGKVEVNIKNQGMNMMALSAHKFNGPKGLGALYVEKGTSLEPQIHGGGHQGGLRSGTMNVPGIVGLEKSLVLAYKRGKEGTLQEIQKYRDEFESKLKESFQIEINGVEANRLPNITNIQFLNSSPEDILNKWSQLYAVGTGSACTSEKIENSHVLKSMGINTMGLRMSLTIKPRGNSLGG
ncbi:MAG: aminotransferase class V-fold PLP-dependent enzyme, partial [Flavobacteriales bacterium]